MRIACAVLLLCMCSSAQLSHKQTCEKFINSVVSIRSGTDSYGTGFIVTSDGWIMTAGHVVVDESESTLKVHSVISVTLPNGEIKLATVVTPLGTPYPSVDTVAEDYAILKTEGSNLTHVDLGDKPDDLVVGSDLTIIGFPFSATPYRGNGPGLKDKFCLSASVAYARNAQGIYRSPNAQGTLNSREGGGRN